MDGVQRARSKERGTTLPAQRRILPQWLNSKRKDANRAPFIVSTNRKSIAYTTRTLSNFSPLARTCARNGLVLCGGVS